MKVHGVTLLLASITLSAHAQTLSGLCMVSSSEGSPARSELMLRTSDCEQGHGCRNFDNSDISWSRWSGISPEALKGEGAQLDANINADAGDLRCSGTVHDGVLAGRYEFTPSPAFLKTMAAEGFTGITPQKQQGFLMLDVSLAWVQQMRSTGVTGLTTDRLMGLRALGVDAEFIHGMAAAGYPELGADKLTEMKAVGVTPDKAREAKSLGFRPDEQELIQMSIFKIDRAFVERMRAKGLENLTLAKLIQVKIFKLDD